MCQRCSTIVDLSAVKLMRMLKLFETQMRGGGGGGEQTRVQFSSVSSPIGLSGVKGDGSVEILWQCFVRRPLRAVLALAVHFDFRLNQKPEYPEETSHGQPENRYYVIEMKIGRFQQGLNPRPPSMGRNPLGQNASALSKSVTAGHIKND